MKCCGKINKPHSIKILDDSVKITFYCPICNNLFHLESKNGMKKQLHDVNASKEPKKLQFHYTNNHKANR